MDAAAKPEKKLEIAEKILKIEVPLKVSRENMSGSKDACQSDATSCISSVDATIKESEVDHESVMSEQGIYYYGYYYPGSNYRLGDWDAQNYAMATDGLEAQHPVNQPDDGSAIYYFPGIQPGYARYSPFLPGGMIGSDGQYLIQQSYYPGQVSTESYLSSGVFPQPVVYGPELLPMYAWDPSLFLQDGLQAGMLSLNPLDESFKSYDSSKNKHSSSKNFQTSKATPEVEKSSAVLVTQTSSLQNQSQKLANKALTKGVSKGYASTNEFSSFTNLRKGGILNTDNPALKDNSHLLVGTEKLKERNKLNRFSDFDILSEKNKGPRTNGTISTVDYSPESFGDENSNSSSGLPATVKKDQFNLPDFPTTYEHAFFFVIKSYSEDDIHKSIKYNVWSSTPHGNKRLDNAFQVAHEKIVETGSKCPVFLFFSVNASGQFCGVAEMTGRVDFSKNMDFWQQDKWNGHFPVKWHIIKDIPNPQFRHIILENNENKPVTNSRDTQEVKFIQGTEMLKIFKRYYSKTSILDDYGFYENRQKAMQAKRNKPLNPSLPHPLPKNNELSQGSKESDSNFKASHTELGELTTGKSKEEPQTLAEVKE